MREIKLTKGFSAYVSEEDYEKVSQFRWCASIESRGTRVYAIRWVRENGRPTKIRMHRFIMGLPARSDDGRVVDHINGDSLDNTRGNLEIITQEENMNRVETWKRAEQPCL